VAGTAVFPGPVKVKVVAVIVVASIAWLKVAVGVVLIATPVLAFVGVTAVINSGGAVAVVNVQVSLAANAIPAEDVTPVVTSAVYVVL
jgi:hypothetical protein